MVKEVVYGLFILFLLIFISGCVDKKDNLVIDFSDMKTNDMPSPMARNLTIVNLNNEIRIYNPCRFGRAEIFLVDDTKSMDGMIDKNHQIVLCKAQDSDIQIGEVMVYNSSNGLIIHRVVGFKDDRIVFKGDNSNNLEYINRSQITHYLAEVIY